MKVSPMSAPQPVNTGATINQKVFSNRTANSVTLPAQSEPIAKVLSNDKVAQSTQITEPISTTTVSAPVDAKMQQALASLTRKEQEIRKAQQSLKLAQEQWRNEQGQYLSKKDLQESTLKVLSEAGITNQRLIELQLGSSQESLPESIVTSELAALKAEIASLKGSTERRDVEARAQAEQIVHNDAKLLVDNDPAYAVTRTLGMQGEVSKLIIQNYDATGEMLSIEEAARMVETELIDRSLKQREQLDQLEVIKKRLAPKEEVVPTALEQSVGGLQPAVEKAIKSVQSRQGSIVKPASTLTHRMGSTRPTTAYERAVQAFEAARLNK